MRTSLALVLACVCLAQQPQPAKKKEPPQTFRSFLVWLARVSGLSATSTGLRGDEAVRSGDVWIEPVRGGARQRLTFEGGYSWPVFSADDRHILALRSGQLWSAPRHGAGAVKLAHAFRGINSLVGSGPDGIVVFTDTAIGVFNPDSGALTLFEPVSEEDRREVNRLRAPVRSYDEGRLTVSGDRGRILVETRNGNREIALDTESVWQPSVSHDRNWLIYIRSAEGAEARQ